MGYFQTVFERLASVNPWGIALLLAGAAASLVAGNVRKRRETKRLPIVQIAGMVLAFAGAIIIFT